MMQPPQGFETPEQQASWRQWVTDSIVWIQDQVKHLHECIERRTGETKELVVQKAAAAEELSESRHQQNIQTLQRVEATVQLLTSFRENATQKEIEAQAVSSERRRLATERAQRREQVKGLAWKCVEYAGAATVIGLAVTGIYAIASLLGLGG